MDKTIKDLIRALTNYRESKNKTKQKDILWKLFQYHFKKFNYNKAKFYLDDIEKINPREPNLSYYYALIKVRDGNYNDSAKLLKNEIKNNKNNNKAKELLKKIKIKENIPIATILIIIICILVYILINYLQSINILTLLQYGFYKNSTIFNLITSIFIHYNIYHLLFNMLALLMFGIIVEKLIGTKLFLLIYFIGGLLGNYMLNFYPNTIVIGASSAIFAIIGTLVILNPFLQLKLFGIFKIKIIYIFSAFFILSTIITIKNYSLFSISHLIGFLSGLLITSLIYEKKRLNFYLWLSLYFGWLFLYYGMIDLTKYNYMISISYLLLGFIFLTIAEISIRRIKNEI